MTISLARGYLMDILLIEERRRLRIETLSILIRWICMIAFWLTYGVILGVGLHNLSASTMLFVLSMIFVPFCLVKLTDTLLHTYTYEARHRQAEHMLAWPQTHADRMGAHIDPYDLQIVLIELEHFVRYRSYGLDRCRGYLSRIETTVPGISRWPFLRRYLDHKKPYLVRSSEAS